MNANALFGALCLSVVVGCGPRVNDDEQSSSGGNGGAPSSGGSGGMSAGAGSAGSGEVPQNEGGVGGGPAGNGASGGAGGSSQTEGAFTFLTYNVAGLPEGISQSHPAVNLSLISPLSNPYEVVVVQENFTFADYAQILRSAATHEYKSTPKPAAGGTDIGDGLNFFSRLFFADQDLYREAWGTCFGVVTNASDCLTSKGFAVVEVRLSEGASFDLYDLHMDAGGAAEDMAARSAQVEQLLAQLAVRSAERAVIVAGDTNMRASEDSLARLLAEGELTDSCRVLSCGDERIDRIFFRNATNLNLAPARWRTADEFVDGSGQPLSDHLAVAVDFAWHML